MPARRRPGHEFIMPLILQRLEWVDGQLVHNAANATPKITYITILMAPRLMRLKSLDLVR